MSEQKQQQPTIESVEYSIIKSVGEVANFAKNAESRIKQLNEIILELAKDNSKETLEKYGIPIPE